MIEHVTREQLLSLIATAEPTERSVSPLPKNGFDLEGWLESLELKGEWKEWAHGRLFILEACPWNPEHLKTARVGQMTDGGLFAGCFHNSCAGNGWREFREAVDPSAINSRRGEGQTKRLVGYVQEAGVELWHTRPGQAFATVDHGGAKAHIALEGRGAEQWLRKLLWDKEGVPATGTVIRDALNTLVAEATLEGEPHEVHVRAGAHGTSRFIDLGSEDWTAVEVDQSGWKISQGVPVRFHRTPGMRPLPVPVRDGAIEELHAFMNLFGEEDFRLAVAFITWALVGEGPFPILILKGEQGSAKTTAARVVISLVDPRTASLSAPPRTEHDLILAASTQRLLGFDNVSGLPAWMADALCRIAVGGGLAVRRLYTGRELELFEACLPVILTGIGDPSGRADLLDRSISLTLRPIPQESRRAEREFWSEFRLAQPRLFGALLDLAADGLSQLPAVPTRGLPRMADFARWGIALERAAGWPDGSFLDAYEGNRRKSQEVALEADVVAGVVMRLMSNRQRWEGTATELLIELNRITADEPRGRGWPTAPNHLSNRLDRLAPVLRSFGIEVERRRVGEQGTRLVIIEKSPTTDGGRR